MDHRELVRPRTILIDHCQVKFNFYNIIVFCFCEYQEFINDIIDNVGSEGNKLNKVEWGNSMWKYQPHLPAHVCPSLLVIFSVNENINKFNQVNVGRHWGYPQVTRPSQVP